MRTGVAAGTAMMAEFVAHAVVSPRARHAAALAFKDTIGVTLAGSREPAAQMAQRLAAEEGDGPCRVLGTGIRTSAQAAAFANGIAAHALDFDDMCFVSLAHPSCGYSKDFTVERLYRDAPLVVIGGGTNELQRLIIAKGLLERHRRT
jgi:2-methylcitrate dehydratase PrpD